MLPALSVHSVHSVCIMVRLNYRTGGNPLARTIYALFTWRSFCLLLLLLLQLMEHVRRAGHVQRQRVAIILEKSMQTRVLLPCAVCT